MLDVYAFAFCLFFPYFSSCGVEVYACALMCRANDLL